VPLSADLEITRPSRVEAAGHGRRAVTAAPAQQAMPRVKRVSADAAVDAVATAHLRSGGGLLGSPTTMPDGASESPSGGPRGTGAATIGRLAASFPAGNGGLSAEQVARLVSLIDEARISQGRIAPGGPGAVVSAIRSGGVQWLGADEVGEPLYSHLFTLAVVASRELGWKFDLDGITPKVQATRYAAEGREHYSWHMDWGLGPVQIRKVAIVVHLSDADDYEGGALQLTNGPRPVEAVQRSGTCTVFPAFVLHRVTPVTAGTRLGAVLWALGPSFR
jgi:PKHD-type hydroxylase